MSINPVQHAIFTALVFLAASPSAFAATGNCNDDLISSRNFLERAGSTDLVEFYISGSGSYMGKVLRVSAHDFELQGQFGPARRFQIDGLKDLQKAKDPTGAPLAAFPRVTGREIDKALTTEKVRRGSFEDAVLLARDAHGPQTYNGLHYLGHLNTVVEVLTRFGITDENLRIAAVLHDTIEDTALTYAEVRARFGKEVADMVQAVSLPKAASRAESFELAYPVIRDTPGALIVKLADRLANFEDALRIARQGDDYYVRKYAGEWAHFRDSLRPAAKGVAIEMMNTLEQEIAPHVGINFN